MQFKVGAKQTTKMLEQDKAIEVYIAQDADPRMIENVLHLCERSSIPVKWVETMQDLGKTCGIDVGAATAALVTDDE
ncbi:large subunit ribosomal protein L7A [Paenibacillus algorifonticola]|uniref:Large subunit ribosomal protein L7A n=1 Tax=Paenibacillus algorifonticola TaxID=684063 RepID=A0A1I2I3Q8_9BACL|nr:ribosomal L7Ae/L30e/S12e/Gadd45 family protein [Paenibacillus algorifonticola]SFF36995.1 large subunit ribosomal protein L7A [Paenibacillus algorifonticola]